MSSPTEMRCPQCKSNNLQVTVETTTSTSGGGYSGSKGCLGFLLLGPLGLLCGSGGKKVKVDTTNTNWWICQKCGHKFRNSEEVMVENAIGLWQWLFAMIGFLVAEHFLGHIRTIGTILWIGFGISLILLLINLYIFIKSKKAHEKNSNKDE